MVTDGSLEVAEALFTETISVTATEWAPQIAGAYVADVGTAMPESRTEPLGSEWSEVHELFHFYPPVTGSDGPSETVDPT